MYHNAFYGSEPATAKSVIITDTIDFNWRIKLETFTDKVKEDS
jgi:hypothetical protein